MAAAATCRLRWAQTPPLPAAFMESLRHRTGPAASRSAPRLVSSSMRRARALFANNTATAIVQSAASTTDRRIRHDQLWLDADRAGQSATQHSRHSNGDASASGTPIQMYSATSSSTTTPISRRLIMACGPMPVTELPRLMRGLAILRSPTARLTTWSAAKARRFPPQGMVLLRPLTLAAALPFQ